MTVGVVVAEGSCAAREFKLSGPDLTFVQMSSNRDLANLRNLLSIVLGARISRVHARSEYFSYFCARRQTNNVFLQGTLAPSMYFNVQWNSHMTCTRYFGPILYATHFIIDSQSVAGAQNLPLRVRGRWRRGCLD